MGQTNEFELLHLEMRNDSSLLDHFCMLIFGADMQSVWNCENRIWVRYRQIISCDTNFTTTHYFINAHAAM